MCGNHNAGHDFTFSVTQSLGISYSESYSSTRRFNRTGIRLTSTFLRHEHMEDLLSPGLTVCNTAERRDEVVASSHEGVSIATNQGVPNLRLNLVPRFPSSYPFLNHGKHHSTLASVSCLYTRARLHPSHSTSHYISIAVSVTYRRSLLAAV